MIKEPELVGTLTGLGDEPDFLHLRNDLLQCLGGASGGQDDVVENAPVFSQVGLACGGKAVEDLLGAGGGVHGGHGGGEDSFASRNWSSRGLNMWARQVVVHDALEMMLCFLGS